MLHYLPIASAAIIVIFAILVFRRYRLRGGRHLLVWGIGLTLFGVGSLMEAYSAQAWSPTVFRLWYLTGATLTAAWLGQGTVYLFSGQRVAVALVSVVLGYLVAVGLFLSLAAIGIISRGTALLLISFHGVIFGLSLHRRWIRRWSPGRVMGMLTSLLLIGSLLGAYLIFTTPLNAARFNAQETLSAQYREILPRGAPVRRLTPIFNIYGLLTLVGGALYSAWLMWRKEIVPNRVIGNILIAIGALAIGFSDIVLRLGLGDYLYLAQLVAATFMFGGFLLATTSVPVPLGAPEVSPT